MHHLALRSFLLASLTVLGFERPAAAGTCPETGWCHLPPWVPAEAAPFEGLGSAVALDGPRAALGAPGGDAVYAYRRTGGVWAQQERLAAPPTSAGGFGSSVALLGDLLVVGDPSDTALGVDAGAAHVYQDVDGSWTWQATLTDPGGAPGARLGTAVDLTSAWAVAGAPGDAEGGRVHLFRASAGWTWAGSIHDFATGTAPEAFGSALAMDGTWLLVGDPASDTHAVDTGAVLTFRVLDVFTFLEDLTVPLALEAGDAFGSALDFDGERAVVGAPGDDGAGAGSGAAYLFSISDVEVAGHEVSLLQDLAACDPAPGDAFGAAVALDGERLAVGAPGQAPAGSPVGRAHVFRRAPGVFPEAWEPEAALAPADGMADDAFGAALALAGGHVLAGAPGANAAGDASGAAYLVSLASTSAPGGECPCEDLASFASVGAGKAGTGGVPGLDLEHGPVPGETSVLRLSSALPGATPLLVWGTTPAALPFDGGVLHVLDAHLLPLPKVDASGVSELVWDVPSGPAVCGAELVLQALLLDPGAGGALHTAQTPGLELRIGW